MTDRDQEDAARWATRAPHVPAHWFLHFSRVHGVLHTQRVHIHAQRLTEQLGWSRADRELVLSAALWHDIGREGDGVEPSHGRAGAALADELGLTAGLSVADAAVARFAIERHSLSDGGAEQHAAELAGADDPTRRLAQPERALRVLWLLKDADALDRIRLGFGECADPRQLRHPQTIELVGFAEALYLAHH
jgi:putative nucleotidyltransferase with HDIG domain